MSEKDPGTRTGSGTSSGAGDGLVNPQAVGRGETEATIRRRASRGTDLDPDEIELSSDRQTGDLQASMTDEARREQVAEQSETYSPGDLRVEGDEVTVRDQVRRQRAAQGTVYEPDELEVTDEGVEPKQDPGPEATRVILRGDDPRGDIAWVSDDGRRIDTGEAAGGQIYSAYVDVPDREGEWRLQVGGETVESVDVGPGGAERDAFGTAVPRGWNGNVISVDASSGTGTLAQEERDPNSVSATADSDVVAGEGAAEALQAGAEPEQLSPTNPIDSSEGERIAEALRERQSIPSGNPARRGTEANQQLREELAAGEDFEPNDLDLVYASGGLTARVEPSGREIDPGEVTQRARDRGVGEEPDALDRLDGDADRGVSITRTAGEGGVATGAPDPERQLNVETGEPDRGVGITRGPEGTTVVRPEQTAADVTQFSQQQLDAQRGPSDGDVRASINRYGQRQLDRQAISTGERERFEETTGGAVDRVLSANANPATVSTLTQPGGLFAETDDGRAPITDVTGISEQDLERLGDRENNPLPTRRRIRRGGAFGNVTVAGREFRLDPEDPEGTPPGAEGLPERVLEGAGNAGASIVNVPARAADVETIIEGLQNTPEAVREDGTGEVGETVTALGRQRAVRTIQRAQSNPARFGGGAALDIAGGAAALGRLPRGRDLAAEVDPRVGFFGETIESRALGLRDRDGDGDTSDVEVDTEQTRGDQVAQLPTERAQTLDPETVDAARGVSGPSATSRVRGELERGIERVRGRVQSEVDRIDVDTRAGALGGSVEVRRETPDAEPDAPTDFSPSRDEVLAGSPRDRIGDDITDRQQAARRQTGGDFDGEAAPFGSDGATFDPTADPAARRRAAERSTVFETDETPELGGQTTTRSLRREILGGAAGGLAAGALARDQAAQQPALATNPATPGVDGDPNSINRDRGGIDTNIGADRDTGIDTGLDQDTRLGTDIRQDLDTRQDIDTRQDLDTRQDTGLDPDPDRPDPDTDVTDRDPRRDPRDPDSELEGLDTEDEESDSVFSSFFDTDVFDSGIVENPFEASDES